MTKYLVNLFIIILVSFSFIFWQIRPSGNFSAPHKGTLFTCEGLPGSL